MIQHAATERRPATYQDVLEAPSNIVAELIEGALHLHPRPTFRPSHAGPSLGDEINSPFHKGRGRPGGWSILDEPELHLGPDVLVAALKDAEEVRVPPFDAIAAFPLSALWPD